MLRWRPIETRKKVLKFGYSLRLKQIRVSLIRTAFDKNAGMQGRPFVNLQ